MHDEHQVSRIIQTLGIEVEVLIAHDRAVGIVDHAVGVVTQVVRRIILGFVGQRLFLGHTRFTAIAGFHIGAIERVVGPFVRSGLRSRVPTGDAGRVTLKRIEAVQRKALAVVLSL